LTQTASWPAGADAALPPPLLLLLIFDFHVQQA
jgi:hypothetical protein